MTLSGTPAGSERYRLPRRWRTASNSATPAATDTFRLSTCPCIGIETSQSQRSRTSRRRPVPSAPSTKAVGSVRSISIVPLAARRRRARPSTRRRPSAPRAPGRCSRPPPSSRARPHRPTPSPRPPPSGAACRVCRTTPSAPAASTVRRIAPTLCGSSIPSSTTSSGGGAALAHQVRDRVRVGGCTLAPRPPDARRPRAARSSAASSTRCTGIRPLARPGAARPAIRSSARRLTRSAVARAGPQRLEHGVDAVDEHSIIGELCSPNPSARSRGGSMPRSVRAGRTCGAAHAATPRRAVLPASRASLARPTLVADRVSDRLALVHAGRPASAHADALPRDAHASANAPRARGTRQSAPAPSRQLGAAIDGRHQQIELRAVAARPVSATRIGWNSACALLAGPLRGPARRPRGTRSSIEQARRIRPVRSASAVTTTARARSRSARHAGRVCASAAPGVVVEQEAEPLRHLVEAIDRRAGHRHDRREELHAPRRTRPPRRRTRRGRGTAATARRRRAGSAAFR